MAHKLGWNCCKELDTGGINARHSAEVITMVISIALHEKCNVHLPLVVGFRV